MRPAGLLDGFREGLVSLDLHVRGQDAQRPQTSGARRGEWNVCDGILRCAPGAKLPVNVDLWPSAYRFASGHRVSAQLSGGAHRRFARNLALEGRSPQGRGWRCPTGPSTTTLNDRRGWRCAPSEPFASAQW